MTVSAADLPLEGYRALIDLDAPPSGPRVSLTTSPGRAAAAVLAAMRGDEALARAGVVDPAALPVDRARDTLRAVLTLRDPGPLPAAAQDLLDALLAHERTTRPVVDARSLATVAETDPLTAYPAAAVTALWQGDITTLAADAVVNAANNALLGCFRPFHPCIDNAIHSVAGPRLRDDCAAIITAQGSPEPTGSAKITRGHHLPARYVLHTVGPIVRGDLRPAHAAALAASYRSCLDVAAKVAGVRTVAFCSISTGVFGYPRQPAARVALATVAQWLAEHPGALDRVVLDVFGDDDLETYRRTLATWTR